MRVFAKHFHPMRGHVDAGREVEFANGNVLIIQPSMTGWALFNAAGECVSERNLDALGLTQAIVQLEAA